MTDILINWLNKEVKLSKKVDRHSFSGDFANGYLIGEVLHNYSLQDDFDQFSQNRTSESKLNNFTRIEPILNLLGIPFDSAAARSIMTERHGEATKLMYQLFIALNKKQKAGLTGTAMETMRPAAPAKLDYMKSLIYKERLKHLTPRQADLNLDALQNEFQQKAVKLEKTAFRLKMEEEERINDEVQRRRLDLMEKRRQVQAQMAERIAKIHAAKIEIPVPPARTLQLLDERKQNRKLNEITGTLEDIAKFEAKLASVLPPSKALTLTNAGDAKPEGRSSQLNELEYLKPKSNGVYISKIRKRLNEDESARNEREKRRRKVLVEQMKAHETQEENRREEMLVNRLMRQSQQERRIAVQLLQARHEKEVIKQNRLFREKQYEERRLREFEDALNREAELSRLAKLDYVEQTKKDQELHAKIAAERAEARYARHYEMCKEMLSEIADVACKVGEYRELTENLLPVKLWKEWKTLFVSGQSLYPTADSTAQQRALGPTPADILELERQAILNEGDFQDYKEMTGDWAPPDDSDITAPPPSNPIVGHVINRLFNMVHPPTPPPPAPEFPAFPIKACILGKAFSGKSTVAQRIANAHRLTILNVDEVVKDAIEAYNSNEAPPREIASDFIESVALGKTPTLDTDTSMVVAANEDQTAEGQGSVAMSGNASPALSQRETSAAPTTQTESAKSASVAKTKGKNKSAKANEPVLTPRAKLGGKALKLLKRGKPVDDQLTVDILAEAIRAIPEGTGWVIDGFPTTYTQAKLLEKALSGFDAGAKDPKLTKEKSIAKSKNSRLAPDPKPAPPPAEPTSAINVVILFDAADAICLKRSAGRYEAQMSQQQYHQEFNPPPEGSITGVQNQEQISTVTDQAYDEQQIQTRITGFLDHWPKLEKWFTKFKILQKVDASLEETPLYLETENILEDTVDRILQRGKYEPIPEPEPEPVLEAEPEPVREPTPPPATPVPEEEPDNSRSSKKGSGKGAKSGSGKKRGSSESPKRAGSGKASGKKSSKGSAKKGKKTPEPEPEVEPVVPPGTPPPEPGSEMYEYVDQPVELPLAECLAPHWDAIENTYIDTSKHTFNDLREERERIIHYFYNIRKDFLKYLKRPDSKQDFIDQWLADYNQVTEDMRNDEETMCELHQKVDDLRDRLWNICDERKVQAETERQDIMNDGWLDDRLGVVSNQHITQMQAEVDRFQDTVQLLKDYYKGMDGHIPDEVASDHARLPLIELPVVDQAGRLTTPTQMAEASQPTPPPEEERATPKSPKGTRSRSATPKGGRKRGKSAKKEEEVAPVTPPPQEALAGRRIPLMPRRKPEGDVDAVAPSATPGKGDAKKDKAAKTAGKKSVAAMPNEEKAESPTQQAAKDPDEKLIIDSYENGVRALSKIIAQEEALRKAAEEAELEAAMAAAAEKEKAAKTDKKGGGKKGKSRSPSPKKGGKGKEKTSAAPVTAPSPLATEETEEEKEKKRLRAKARDEFFAAIKIEESACKVRLELIKLVAIKTLTKLKDKADDVYKDMNDWLGARFLKEIESIDQMSEKMRHAVESRSTIKEQIKLVQEDFLIAEDVKTLRSPSPPARPDPVEYPQAEYFTVNQLMSLYTQFTLVAKDGVISVKSFIDIFQEFTSLTHGMEMLPDNWMHIQLPQLQDLAAMLSFDGEYINWKSFVTAVAQPISLPTNEELMETLNKFKVMDQKNLGYVTREQYNKIDLWFRVDRMLTPENSSEPYQYNRLENIKRSLFDFFANHAEPPSKLFYRELLMYFSVDSDAYQGFLRALSVVSDKLISAEANEDAAIYLVDLYEVLHHGEGYGTANSHRFALPLELDKSLPIEKLRDVYQELCDDVTAGISFRVLTEHPIIQDCISKFNRFKQADLASIFNPVTPGADLGFAESLSIKE
ncbi:sperm flagellar protein 2-like [Watersipora subatra]|uniref:sperm flagellar protein 2-like n=1 Tax=Watersipora subatra TaxID=2589382 RepID=UPI00355B9DDB